MKNTKTTDAAQSLAARRTESPAFNEMVNLLAVFSDASSRLEEIQATANSELLVLIDEHKSEYAKLQEICTRTETTLESICKSHPEWFVTAKSIRTPYGTVAFRSGTSLEVKDVEATVKLLRAEEDRCLARGQVFVAGDYIRITETPDLEALEALDDTTLAKFMVKRVSADSFGVKAATINFGKAVKEAVAAKN